MSRTLTALYSDPATAEAAMERLRAIGLPESSMELHRTGEGDIVPGAAPTGGLFGLRDILAPDRAAEGGAVLVALRVADELVSEAVDILEEEAVQVDRERDAT
jgi:hypothetical protein